MQALSACSSSESDESDTEQVSATQVDTEAQLEVSSSTVASSLLLGRSKYVRIPTNPVVKYSQRRDLVTPNLYIVCSKRHGLIIVTGSIGRQLKRSIICRNVYALGQLTMSRNKETEFGSVTGKTQHDHFSNTAKVCVTKKHC